MNAHSHGRAVFIGGLALGALLGVGGCNHIMVPGLLPLVGPPRAPIVPEPAQCSTNSVPSAGTATPIIGAADLHIHQFANLGFGGRFLWGAAFDKQGIEHALSSCGVEGMCWDDRELVFCREVICRLKQQPDRCRADCDLHRCDSSPPHGHLGTIDPVGAVLGQGTGHSVRGYPDFQGWPHWNTYTHQQAYYRWLKRALDGGLKLIVMLAVNNEVLCKFLGHDHACDDMANADLQLEAAWELQKFVGEDQKGNCGPHHKGWYRIATSPKEAREIIADGGMAVVLGMEVDTLFNCYRRGNCTRESIHAAIKKYRDLGVRHLFPVHLFDNAFGGTAASDDFFNFGNVVVNHGLLDVEDCSKEGYEFKFDGVSGEVRDFLSAMAKKFGVNYERYPAKPAHCNTLGLSELGKTAIELLMDEGMIIDVDHMSRRTRAAVLEAAKKRNYRGLVSGHSGFTELLHGKKKHEGQLTLDEVNKLLALQGLLAPILNQSHTENMVSDPRLPSRVNAIPNDCGNSVKSFARAYLYAVDKTTAAIKANPGAFAGVGFGSDLNGLAGMPTPRFGPFACGGDLRGEQTHRVMYPIEVYPGASTVTEVEPMQAGYRKFDINVDGYANVGMFPDFVAELHAIGLTDDDLKPLFSSAEAYIQLWERVEDATGLSTERTPSSPPRATAPSCPCPAPP